MISKHDFPPISVDAVDVQKSGKVCFSGSSYFVNKIIEQCHICRNIERYQEFMYNACEQCVRSWKSAYTVSTPNCFSMSISYFVRLNAYDHAMFESTEHT